MKRSRVWMLLACWALGAATGCGKASSERGRGGENDWLQRCSTSASSTSAGSTSYECGPDLECVCGVCTRACSSDSACTSLSEEGRCSESATAPFASACELDAPEQICVRAPSEGGAPAPRLGRRFDVAGQCYGALELAGYSAAGAAQACLYPDVVGVRQGDCWQFPGGCLPDGFFDAHENPLVDPVPCPYPKDLCPEELSCSAERVPTGEGCVSCEDARRRLTFSMIELVVRAELDQCIDDSDCVAEGWGNGCDGQCPVALGRDFLDTFRSALPSLTRHYCSDPEKWRTTCGQRVGDCVVAPVCRRGRCFISNLQ
jgi:hypothetical protein